MIVVELCCEFSRLYREKLAPLLEAAHAILVWRWFSIGDCVTVVNKRLRDSLDITKTPYEASYRDARSGLGRGEKLWQDILWLRSRTNEVTSGKPQPFVLAISFGSNPITRSRTDERLRTDVKEAKTKCIDAMTDIFKTKECVQGHVGL